MDAALEDIIRNIIHIDKSAIKLRESLDKEIGDRRTQVNQEIERLRVEILESEIQRVDALEKKERECASAEAEEIRSAAVEKCRNMYNKFSEAKSGLIREMFSEIFSI